MHHFCPKTSRFQNWDLDSLATWKKCKGGILHGSGVGITVKISHVGGEQGKQDQLNIWSLDHGKRELQLFLTPPPQDSSLI